MPLIRIRNGVHIYPNTPWQLGDTIIGEKISCKFCGKCGSNLHLYMDGDYHVLGCWPCKYEHSRWLNGVEQIKE